MAECNLLTTSIEATDDYKDSVVYKYQADLGQIVTNPLVALLMAQSLGPDPVPQRRAALSGGVLFARNFHGERASANRSVWLFDVTFSPPDKGEDQDQQTDNPLLRPPVFGITYVDEEYVVKQAKNVEELGSNTQAGGPYRAANTLDAITNAAGKRPDEPIVRTRRRGVITIAKNYADLGEIMDLNETYQQTCNSDSVTLGSKTFQARRLKYECTHEGGKQVENNITFYPGVTEIGIYDTTDLVFDNVGFDYWTTGGILKRAQASNGDTAEPVNLNLDGTKKDDDEGPTQITYRDLDEVAYASFFE